MRPVRSLDGKIIVSISLIAKISFSSCSDRPFAQKVDDRSLVLCGGANYRVLTYCRDRDIGAVAQMVLDGGHALGISGTLPVIPSSVAAERLFSFSKRMVTIVASGSRWAASGIRTFFATWRTWFCPSSAARTWPESGDDTGTIQRADDSSCPKITGSEVRKCAILRLPTSVMQRTKARCIAPPGPFATGSRTLPRSCF